MTNNATDYPELMKELSSEQKLIFTSQFEQDKKNATTAILLAILLGGLGAHHFYMKAPILGIVYVLFFWTFIPAIVALIEAFFLPSRVRDYNRKLASELSLKAKSV